MGMVLKLNHKGQEVQLGIHGIKVIKRANALMLA
jgi:hypothetical protein